MSLPPDMMNRAKGALATLGLPSDVLQEMTADPSSYEFIFEQLGVVEAFAKHPTKGSFSMLSCEEIALAYKERCSKERLLPPTKPPPLRKEFMKFQLDILRKGFPSTEVVGDNVNSPFPQMYTGHQLEYCSTPVSELTSILLSEMMIRKTHKGRYLLCRIIARPSRIIAIMAGVEDTEGNPARLAIYNYPTLFEATLDDLDSIFPIGTILLIREPTYKFSVTGTSSFIRVDTPSDIVFIGGDNPLLRNIRWKSEIGSITRFPTTVEKWRARGLSEFKAQRWLSAAVCLTNGLKLDNRSQVLLLNRAEIYLRLGWNFSALHDITMAMQIGPIADEILKRKAILRQIRANYGLGRYEDVVHIARKHSDDEDCMAWLTRSIKRITERNRGKYDWSALFECSRDGVTKLELAQDVAEFRGPIEIKELRNHPGMLGVFATRDVKIGELLNVCRPLDAGLPPETRHEGEEFLSFNFLREKTGRVSNYTLILRLIHRLWDDARANAILKSMYAGPLYDMRRGPPPSESMERLPLEHPLKSTVDIDVARIEAVTSLNAFGTNKGFGIARKDPDVEEKGQDMTVLYEIPSYCNHSCIPSANKTIAGDVMVLRAARAIKAGEEVTLSYVSADSSLAVRTEMLKKKWKFSCDCVLCKAERSDGMSICATRAELCKKAESLGHLYEAGQADIPKEAGRRYPSVKSILDSAIELQEGSDEWYRCAFKPELFVIACQLSRMAMMRCSRVEASQTLAIIDAEMQVLELAGFVIRDRRLSELGQGNPLDLERSYCPSVFYGRCVEGCLIIAKAADVLNCKNAIRAWVNAAKWIFSLIVADDIKLFSSEYEDLLKERRLTEYV